MFSAAAFHAVAANQAKSSASKKIKSTGKEVKPKERKEPDHVKVNSSKLTCEQIREILNFDDHDSEDRRALHLAALATLPKVVTLSLRFDSESAPQPDDSASESEQEPDKAKDRKALVLTGASIVALDNTVHLVLDQLDGRTVLLAETVIGGAASLLGIDRDVLDNYCYLYTGGPIRENEDLSRPFGALNDRRELQFRPFPQCDLCMMPIRFQKGSTIVCEHKFNGHLLAACTTGGCCGSRDFCLPSGTLTVARVNGGLEAAFAPTGQKPARLTADFFTPAPLEVRTPQSPDDTDDDELPSPKQAEVVMLDDDDDKPIVADKKRKLEHRLSEPAAKKTAHYQPQAQLTKIVPQKPKVAVLPSVTEPEPTEQPKVPKVPKEPKEHKVQEVPKEPTGTNVADDEHAKLAKLFKALCGSMSVHDACNVSARVAAFWHKGPAALGSCIESIVALKCSSGTINEAITLVAINWPRSA